MGGLRLEASPGKKLARPHPNNNKKLGVMLHTCHPSCAGSISRKIKVQASPGKKCEILPEK
jgi:hypothetical protein